MKLAVLLAVPAVLLLGGCEDAGPSTVTTVEVRDFQFVPSTVTTETGKTVTWEWVGAEIHNVTWSAGTPAGSPDQSTGTYSRTFATAGSFSYFCSIHPDLMTGTITVQ
jgi:plastocyanin